MRRATKTQSKAMSQVLKFQSTLSVRRATIWRLLREHGRHISIHALREESDQLEFWSLRTDILFQSTLSVRRATYFGSSESDVRFHFNPRSPWGERPYIDFATYLYINISIHALREESDSVILYASFNASSISIHALREESDKLLTA